MIHSERSYAAGYGPSHYQYAQPFHLPEVATIGGKRVSGTKARVYWLLRLTAERGFVHPVGQLHGYPGWVPRFLVVEPWSGGGQGDRRLRSLREDGVRIDLRSFESSTTTLYRYAGEDLVGVKPAPATEALRGPLAGVEVQVGHVAGPAGLKCLVCPARSVEGILNRPCGVALDVTPGGGSLIAPAGSSSDGTDEAYLAELRGHWASGALVAAFRGASLASVTAQAGGAWCPLPVLAKALSALGADVVFEGEA